jgi:hypothetical protein
MAPQTARLRGFSPLLNPPSPLAPTLLRFSIRKAEAITGR